MKRLIRFLLHSAGQERRVRGDLRSLVSPRLDTHTAYGCKKVVVCMDARKYMQI